MKASPRQSSGILLEVWSCFVLQIQDLKDAELVPNLIVCSSAVSACEFLGQIQQLCWIGGDWVGKR